jgi:hypothetical protein
MTLPPPDVDDDNVLMRRTCLSGEAFTPMQPEKGVHRCGPTPGPGNSSFYTRIKMDNALPIFICRRQNAQTVRGHRGGATAARRCNKSANVDR